MGCASLHPGYWLAWKRKVAMTGARKVPSLRRYLFKIHQDLENVVERSSWWTHDDLSDLEVLILLLEDRRFIQHWGVDWRSVVRELIKALMLQKHGGASTIDMQFVRTRTGFKERTLKRKLYEMLLALLLQFRMQKIPILRSYLSIMYLGHHIRGINEAARVVYGKDLWELDLSENALIASMMVYPRPKHPTALWEARVTARANYGLKLFARLAHRYKQRLD